MNFANDTKLIRVGIIGLGRMASSLEDEVLDGSYISHAAAIRAEAQFELTAGSDVEDGQCKRFRQRWNVRTLHGSAREMLSIERPELVCVCSPTEWHVANCVNALEAGCRAIFCEKPISSTLEEGDALIRQCRETGVILAVNHTRRWTPNFRLAREIVQQGQLGKIQSVVAHYGGGVGNIGTHLFDLLRFLLGDVEAVTALADWVSEGDPDLSGYLEFSEGFGCHIVANDTRAHFFFEIDIVGTEGRLRIRHNGQILELYGLEASPTVAYGNELRREAQGCANPDHTASLRLAYRELAGILQGTQAGGPACSGVDGVAAMEIACGLVTSSRNARARILLPLTDRGMRLPSRQRGNVSSASIH